MTPGGALVFFWCPSFLKKKKMIAGEIKNKIDAIWSTFWGSAGITNPMDALSQMTYLFFLIQRPKALQRIVQQIGDRQATIDEKLNNINSLLND